MGQSKLSDLKVNSGILTSSHVDKQDNSTDYGRIDIS